MTEKKHKFLVKQNISKDPKMEAWLRGLRTNKETSIAGKRRNKGERAREETDIRLVRHYRTK